MGAIRDILKTARSPGDTASSADAGRILIWPDYMIIESKIPIKSRPMFPTMHILTSRQTQDKTKLNQRKSS